MTAIVLLSHFTEMETAIKPAESITFLSHCITDIGDRGASQTCPMEDSIQNEDLFVAKTKLRDPFDLHRNRGAK